MNSLTVLIAEDNATNLKLLRVTLEAEGHRVLQAANGVEALAWLEREPVDAVITDIFMPQMDRFRLCVEIRRSEKLRHVPIIIYSSTYTSPGDEKLALDVGADRYLRKPVAAKDLVAALADVTRKPHAHPPGPVLARSEVLKKYSGRLVSKLEEKNSELTDAEAKFRALVEQSIVGIYVIQEDR